MLNIDDLTIGQMKQIAEAATQGPWNTDTVHNEGSYGSGPDCCL